METTRQSKISRLLQKELSEIFRQQTAKTHGVIVSVSTVRVSPEYSAGLFVDIPIGESAGAYCQYKRQFPDYTL